MEFHISLDDRPGGLATSIYRGLCSAIVEGRLGPGDQLPASRELARSLAVSRNTVATAYERLVAEGILIGRPGAGTFVSTEVGAARPRNTAPMPGPLPRPGWAFVPSPTSSQTDVPRYDFRAGIPDPDLFPFDTWRRLIGAELRQRANSPGLYAEPSGHVGLREAIAAHVAQARSVRTTPDDVLVTNGTQHAIDLIGRVLVTPGDIVAVEEPGHPPVGDLLSSLGSRVIGVPVDEEGLVVTQLPPTARIVYTTPSHQFPLGTAMSLRRRTALLSWAEEHDAVVIEDDYDSEFRFSHRPLDPLQSLDTSGRVIYVGSFSKTMLPSLRMGFAVAPASLRPALRAARQLSDGHGPVPTQAALARFIADGLLSRHIRQVTKVYGHRHQAIVKAIETDLAPWLQLVPSTAGLHVCAMLRSGDACAVESVVEAARDEGLALEPLAPFYRRAPAAAGFVLGYGALATERAEVGLTRFRRLLERLAS